MSARVNTVNSGTTARPVRRAAGTAKVGGGALTGLSFAKRPDPADAPRVTAFEIDGTPYTVPAVVETGAAMLLLLVVKAIDDPIRQGIELIRELAGQDALEALVNQASFTHDDWRKLIDSLWTHAFGPLEEVEGSGN